MNVFHHNSLKVIKNDSKVSEATNLLNTNHIYDCDCGFTRPDLISKIKKKIKNQIIIANHE